MEGNPASLPAVVFGVHVVRGIVGMKRPPRTYAPAFEPTYQFTPAASKDTAFAWMTGEPSIFSRSRAFMVFETGRGASEAASVAVREHEERTGRSPGTLMGLSKSSDEKSEEFTRRLMASRKARAAA
jgi:hypothetical protein